MQILRSRPLCGASPVEQLGVECGSTLCQKKNLDPERVVKDGEPCTPGVALRRIPVQAYNLKLAEKQKAAA
jgi:hypothetical protein